MFKYHDALTGLLQFLNECRGRIEKAFGKDEGAKVDFFPTTFILPVTHLYTAYVIRISVIN